MRSLPRFQTSVLSYSIVKDDVVAHPVVVDRDNLKADMYHKDSVKVTKKKIMRPSVTMVPLLSICMLTSSFDTTEGMDAADILQYQMDTFNRIMKENIKNSGQKIIFIHGKGAACFMLQSFMNLAIATSIAVGRMPVSSSMAMELLR